MSKATATVYVSNLGDDVCSPFFSRDGIFHAVIQNSGVIIQLDSNSGKMQTLHTTNGMPSGAIFDANGSLLITDMGYSAVLAVQDGEQESVVAVYEDRPLKGPHSVISDRFGNIYFTDSGPLGDTGLASPSGSVYCITNSPGSQILKPISLNNLAYPTGIAVSPDGKFIYVAEMMKNRLLRFFERPEGVFHGSVFYQFSGGVGPSSVACDASGTIYVGHFDIKDTGSDGRVFVISKTGKLLSVVQTPEAPEISGVTCREGVLYISERSTGSIFKVDV
jgi:sugar lactone lactonase YvrE